MQLEVYVSFFFLILTFVHSRNVKRRRIPASAIFSTKFASSIVSPASARAKRIPEKRGKHHHWTQKKRASDINISTIRPSSLWCLSHIAYRIAWSVLVTLLGKKMHLLAPTFINVTVKHIYRLQRICPRPVARWESSQSILTSKIKQNHHTNFGKMVHSEVEPQIQRKTNYHFACLVSSDWLT